MLIIYLTIHTELALELSAVFVGEGSFPMLLLSITAYDMYNIGTFMLAAHSPSYLSPVAYRNRPWPCLLPLTHSPEY